MDEIPVGKLKHVEIDRNQIIVEMSNKPMLLPISLPSDHALLVSNPNKIADLILNVTSGRSGK